MHRRLWLSVAMLVTGASLLVASSFASAAGNSGELKKGGIWRAGTTGASTQIDPQLAYVTTAWWLEYATAAKLFNYPDKAGPAGSKLVPEVASKFAVSNGGKRYTFTIRKGFKFSDGKPVTANSFKFAINRTANHDLASPGAQFIMDPTGTNIVGAKAVNDGNGTNVSGVQVKGNKLIVNLTRGDGTFMSKITMPFFQATSSKLPLTKEIVNVSGNDLPSAGPYYISRNAPDDLTQLRQNKYWTPGAGRNRPRNIAGLDYKWNLNEQTGFNQVKANQLDEGPLPAAEVQGVANQYGVNKTRFWSKSQNCTGYLPLNTANSLFKNNLPLRQAVNYASQPQAVRGPGWSVCRSAVDAPLQPGCPRLEERQDLPAEHEQGAHAGPRSHEGREDHRLLPLVRFDEPSTGADREAGPDQPRLRERQHQDEAVLGR